MDKKDKRRVITYIIFGLIFALRLIHINNPPLDYSSWRQVDTDSIARNFLEYRFNIFYPQLNYDGPMPNYVQLEFQITTFIIAILYKIFGYNNALARLVPVAFFMASCYYFYRLVKLKSGINIAIVSVLFYGILPINIIYSRNIMPESALMFFSIAALYYFILWIDRGYFKYYAAAVLFTTFTILTKLPAAVVGIPMIYLSYKKYGWKVFKSGKLILFPIIVFGVPYIYFKWLSLVAEQKFVSGIGMSLLLPNLLNSILKTDTLKYLTEQFALKIFTVPGVILFAAGVVVKKKNQEYFYYAWLLGALFHVIFIDAVIHLDYYLMIITPVISVFMAYTSVYLIMNKRFQYFFYIGLIIVVLGNYVLLKGAYSIQRRYIVFGDYINRCTYNGELVIIDNDSPELFYTSGRKGWRLYGDFLSLENINNLRKEGARYLALLSPSSKPDVVRELDTIYEKQVSPEGYYLYKLYALKVAVQEYTVNNVNSY